MSINGKFFCPSCGALWDCVECTSCDHTNEEEVKTPIAVRKHDFREETMSPFRNKRNRRKKPTPVKGDSDAGLQ